MTNKPELMLWLSDGRGHYIPRDFAKSFKDRDVAVSGVNPDDWATLEDPDHEWYWEAWDNVQRDAIVTDENGNKYTVYQEGNCWLVPVGMEWSEEKDFFDWPKESGG
jgi:hypothetical protein